MYHYNRILIILDENSKKEKGMPEIFGKCFVDTFGDNNVKLICAFDQNALCNPDCVACTLANDNGVTAYACKRGNFKMGDKKHE